MTTPDASPLRRTLGFWALLAYGVGDMLGAGIYALVGKVAGIAGAWAWASFALAMIAATLTACVYAELATRFPQSGGAAYYCERAFKKPALSVFIGWLVLCSGVVSMATSSLAFAGYFNKLGVAVPVPLIVCAFLFVVGTIAIRGIRESSTSNMICTAIELSGLLIVVVTGLMIAFGNKMGAEPVQTVSAETVSWLPILILQGAGLAFFACIGFEDIANVAEEVKDPERNIPRGLLSAMVVVGTVYMLVAFVSTRAVPPQVLGASEAPLLTVVEYAAPSFPLKVFSGIAMFAVANTSLLNCVMGSRLLYGMSREQLLPDFLGRVHPTRHTPYIATLVVIAIALVLALTGTVQHLGGTTSLLLLIVFIVVDIALLLIRRERKDYTGFRVPIIVPLGSIAICAVLIVFSQQASMGIAAVLGAIGAIIAIVRWKTIQAGNK